MPKTTLIPIHLDALYVAQAGIDTIPPIVDFTQLDQCTGTNPSKAYLGESLTAAPGALAQSSALLQAGVHLHWALPDALTKTMGLPLVKKRSFQNILGITDGDNIWDALIRINWISPLPGQSATAKVLKSRKDRSIAPVSIPSVHFNSVNAILDHQTFPAVPNRWLITRFKAEGTTPDKQWVVESDFVWPDKDSNKQGVYTAYPTMGSNSLDYCYLGRSYELGSAPASSGSYLPDPLTAVGYGEATFAALYPNCRTVFGFCDENQPAGSTYEVLGWYNDPTQDYFALFSAEYLAADQSAKSSAPYPYIRLLAALKEEFQWFIPILVKKSDINNDTWWTLITKKNWIEEPTADSGMLSMMALERGNTLGVGNEGAEDAVRTILNTLIHQQLPAQTLYYAQCTANPDNPTLPDPAKLTLALGNTGAEAMSAYLAGQIAISQKGAVEDYLEAHLQAASLQPQHVDLGPKFKEMGHLNGFQAVPSGAIWTVRTQSATNNKASDTKNGEEITLPDVLADMLNTLNNLQQQFDKTNFEVESIQQQIFADWCNYLKLELQVLATGGDANQPGQQGGGDGEAPQPGMQGGGDGDTPQPGTQQGSIITPEELQQLLDEIRSLLHWEIDVLLQSRLDKLQAGQLPQDIATAQGLLEEGLALYEQKNQYVQTDDIKVWKEFGQALQQDPIAAILSSNFTPNDDLKTWSDFNKALLSHSVNRQALSALNKALIDAPDLHTKLKFPNGKKPREATDLDAYQNTPTWSAAYFRYNRLLLEAWLPVVHRPRFVLQSTAAPRYWQPAEPNLLIAGVQPTLRHGQDGRLRQDGLLSCATPINLDAPPPDQNSYQQIAGRLEQIKATEPDNFALHPGTKHWHPLLMDWEIPFTAIAQLNGRYPDDYLEKHYSLALNTVDFSKNTLAGGTLNPFSGRCVLTPSGSLQQKNAVIRNLVSHLLETVKNALYPAGSTNQTLSCAQFASWVKATLSGKDEKLITIVAQPAVTGKSDTQQIADWINQRLSNTNDLPGLVSWYWTQVQADLNAFDSSAHPGNSDEFVSGAIKRLQLKKAFYNDKSIPAVNQSDFELKNNHDFPTWLAATIGSSALNQFFNEKKFSPQPAEGNPLNDFLLENFNTLINWYQTRVRSFLHKVLDYLAYSKVYTVAGLSQSLGGFNKALVNLSQTYQLDIADPPGVLQSDSAAAAAATALADKVRKAVQQQNSYSPVSAGDYAPLRAGLMSLRSDDTQSSSIQLINNFGQPFTLVDPKQPRQPPLVCTEAMAIAESKNAALAPRLVQPARLNFRWLSARSSVPGADVDLAEMNSHPAAGPICGWLLPNNLDNSLMVYHQNGQALGYIDQAGRWRVFPGHDGPVSPEDIDNPHLSGMVQRMCRLSLSQSDYISDFITVLNTAADSIAPDNSAQHTALSLQMSRPIALVRAVVSLEQRGLSVPYKRSDPVNVHYADNLKRYYQLTHNGTIQPGADDFSWDTYEYETVKIPVRLGEFRQLNDGMMGYWVDAAPAGAWDSALGPDTFFAPQSFDPDKLKHRQPAIKTHDEDGAAFQFHLNFAAKEPIQLSILMDPRGKIHATCGLLPVKSIHLPPDQYQPALSRIEVAFLTAPLLTLPGRTHVSLPREAGFGWSWVEKDGQAWKTVNSVGNITLADVQRAFPTRAGAVWGQLKAKAWIVEILPGNATVTPKDQRAAALDSGFQAELPLIEAMLEHIQLNPFDTSAAFSGTPEIREGWLKLTKNNS